MFNLISSLGIGAGQSIWNIIINIFSFIPKLMYLITTSFFSILDVLQLLFRKLAGLDSYYIQTGGIESAGDLISGGQTVQQTGDILEEFILGIFTNKYPILYNNQILFSHEPIPNTKYFNIHGHIHNKDITEIDYITGNYHLYFNVSAEKINYTPINLKDIPIFNNNNNIIGE